MKTAAHRGAATSPGRRDDGQVRKRVPREGHEIDGRRPVKKDTARRARDPACGRQRPGKEKVNRLSKPLHEGFVARVSQTTGREHGEGARQASATQAVATRVSATVEPQPAQDIGHRQARTATGGRRSPRSHGAPASAVLHGMGPRRGPKRTRGCARIDSSLTSHPTGPSGSKPTVPGTAGTSKEQTRRSPRAARPDRTPSASRT